MSRGLSDLADLFDRQSAGSGVDFTTGLRAEQVAPAGDDWSTWLVMAGRGFGKTHAGARWLLGEAYRRRADYAVVAPTHTDARKICVEGPSGLLAALNTAGQSYDFNRSTWRIALPNSSVIHMLSADRPDRIRGYNLAGAWCDEVASWRYDSAWYDGLAPALRIGTRPRVCVTTTPRSTRLMRDLAGRSDGSVVVTRGSTWDNAANLSRASLAEFARWEGTTRGRQELHGELLDDLPGALWRRSWVDSGRVDRAPGGLRRVVVGVDPSGTSHEGSDECGIVVCGRSDAGDFFVLNDASRVASPDQWARVVAAEFDRWQADRVVAEKNYGGDMISSVLRHVRRGLPITMVNASRGKAVRAEPIAALYEQGRVHHVGAFVDLEDELCTWQPGDPGSPDRLDALVWALTELGEGGGFLTDYFKRYYADDCPGCGVTSRAVVERRCCPHCGWSDPVLQAERDAAAAEGVPYSGGSDRLLNVDRSGL
jgi:phage terminase large subunit-like protein